MGKSKIDGIKVFMGKNVKVIMLGTRVSIISQGNMKIKIIEKQN